AILEIGAAENDDHGGKTADQDRIDKGTQHSHQPLFGRFVVLGLPMVHGSTAQSGLVGEHGPAHPDDHQAPRPAGGHGLKVPSLHKDKFQGGKDRSGIGGHDKENGQEIESHHKGDNGGGHFGNLGQAPKDHHRRDGGQDKTYAQFPIELRGGVEGFLGTDYLHKGLGELVGGEHPQKADHAT